MMNRTLTTNTNYLNAFAENISNTPEAAFQLGKKIGSYEVV